MVLFFYTANIMEKHGYMGISSVSYAKVIDFPVEIQ